MYFFSTNTHTYVFSTHTHTYVFSTHTYTYVFSTHTHTYILVHTHIPMYLVHTHIPMYFCTAQSDHERPHTHFRSSSSITSHHPPTPFPKHSQICMYTYISTYRYVSTHCESSLHFPTHLSSLCPANLLWVQVGVLQHLVQTLKRVR